MSRFTKAAMSVTTLSKVMEGREKITMDELIEKYPNYVTITEFDVVTVDGSSYPVFAFAEDEGRFFNGGAVLTNIVHAWGEEFGGDITTASEELKREGGVKAHLYKTKTKKGNTITGVRILE